MPELTVALHMHNAAGTIADAIDSVLQQQEVDFELVVVDNGSTDNSVALVRALADARLTLINVPQPRSAGYCYNLALARSQAKYFATLHADCRLRPGALRKLVDACRTSPDAGMAHGNFFPIDAEGRATRDAFRTQRELFHDVFNSTTKYQNNLLLHGNIAHHLRLYARAALTAVGGFEDRLAVDADYDIAIKIADRYAVQVLPEYLYCRCRRSRSKARIRARRLRDWLHRIKHYRRFATTNRISLFNDKKTVQSLLAKSLCQQLGWAAALRSIVSRLGGWYWRIRLPAETILYDLSVEALARHAFAPSSNGDRAITSQHRRIAYYTWHFPVLSQTFINRELAALKQAGVAVEIIADEPEDVELADDNAKSVLDQAHYLEPIDPARLRGYHRRLFRSRPLEYLKSFGFVVSRQYGSYKTIHEDLAVFSRAVYLAGVARERNVDHLHAPWSDRCAFVAMLAARLAGITYSVQARAHDIHRNGYLFALAEKFEPAQFIVTNTRFNEAYMKTFLRQSHWSKLFVIHNGIDLHRFVPAKNLAGQGATIKLLCVARLIEQKGLIYLLRACAQLRAQGYDFDCEIVGGTEDIFMNYYLDVKRLHRQLGLERQVRFSGSLPFSAVLEKYAQADIFVLPCVIAADGSRDITPNAVLEAMAMKLPVVSTTVTGVPELVEDGVSGILVPPNDEKALTAALARLIQDRDLRKHLGDNARKKVKEKFDIDKNIAAYVRLFAPRAIVQGPAAAVANGSSPV